MARKAAESNPETESIEQLLAGKRPKRVTPERLEQLLRDWPDHAGTKLYCYRIRPEVDFSQVSGKKGTNVAILMAPFPEDLRSWFIENHGGGKYEIKFNDANQPFTNIVTCFIDIPNSEADPILDVRTLVRGGNENEQLIQKWLNDGTIAKDAVGQLMPAATAAGHAQPAGDGTPQSVIDLMTHTYKKSFDMAIQQNDPMKMLEVLNQIKGENKGLDLPMLVMLIKALQPPPPPPAPPPDTSVAIMLKSLSDQNTLLLTKLLEPKPENSGSGLSQVKELLEVMGTMRDELAPLARGARGGGGWQETLRAIAPALAPALAPLAMRLLAPAEAPAPAQVPAAPAAGTQPAANPAVDPVQRQLREGNQLLAQLILNCLNRGLDGADLATTIDLQWGEQAYIGIVEMGAAQIKTNMQAHAPELWAQISTHGEAELDELLKDFVAAFETADDAKPEKADT